MIEKINANLNMVFKIKNFEFSFAGQGNGKDFRVYDAVSSKNRWSIEFSYIGQP